MSKYGKYTGGQIEAVLNMIGGEEVIDCLLQNKANVVVTRPATTPVKDGTMQVCGVFSGNHCSICGGYFGDGDDICAHGHEIGQSYQK